MPFDIQAWQIHEIFLMDAFTYVLAFIIILFIKYKPIVKKNIDQGNMFSRLIKGFSFLKENSLIFIFGVCSYAIFTFLIVEMFVLVPVYVSNYLKEGGDVFASSEVYYSIGALLAGFGIRKVMGKNNIITNIIILMVATIGGCLLLTYFKSITAFFAVSLLIGLSNAGTRILRITFLFEKVSNDIIGRTGSVFNSVSILIRTALITSLSLPYFNSGDNVRYGYLLGAIFLCIALIPLIKYRKKLSELKSVNT